MNITDCSVYGQLMLRMPALPFNKATDWQQLMKRPFFKKAIRLASPSLYAEMANAQFDFSKLPGKAKESLWRYRNRMMYRPTPFGLFATVSAVPWGSLTSVHCTQMRVAARPDFKAIISAGESGVQQKELLMANGTIYKAGSSFRYLAVTTGEKDRSFSVRALSANEVLAQVIECLEKPLNYVTLCDKVQAVSGLPVAECKAMIMELIDIQFLVPDTNDQINITGEDYVKRKMIQVNHPGYADYVIASRGVKSGSIDDSLQQKLLEGLECLSRLNSGSCSGLEVFKKAFTDKFDRRRVPLLEALDPVIGVPFATARHTLTDASLLQTAGFETDKTVANATIGWSPVHSLLMDGWLANANRFAPIVLTSEGVASLPLPDANIPNSFAIIFRSCGGQVLFESAGGATATSLLGRFTMADETLLDTARWIASAEQRANPDVVFAEICHIENYHTGNIDRRQTLYDFEIPICCGSVLDHDHQLPLSDLSVCIADGVLYLWSEKLQKRVVPRLSSAYNHTRSTLPVFRFLCCLQHEQLQSSFTLDLASFFPGQRFYPRVVYKDAILCLATWILDAATVSSFASAPDDNLVAAIKDLSCELQWPRFISVCEYDNTLLFDLENDEDVRHLAACFRTRKQLVVREFPEDLLSAPLPTTGDKAYLHQLVTFVYHNKKVYEAFKPPLVETGVKRQYVPGSDWLYYKLYLHPAESNRILTEKILPCVEMLKKQRIVHKWFFVRYRDPKYHLRLRIQLKPLNAGWAMTAIEKVLGQLAEAGIISNYCIDTYTREIERYSAELIDECEQFFCEGTVLMAFWFSKFTFDDSRYEYYYIGFLSVQWLFRQFQCADKETTALLMHLYQLTLAQMAPNKAARYNSLAKRQFRQISQRFSGTHQLEETVARKLRKARTALIGSIGKLAAASAGWAPEKRQQLLTDLTHMHLNRLFTDNGREQEIIFYYCLSRLMASRIAREDRKTLSPAANDTGG